MIGFVHIRFEAAVKVYANLIVRDPSVNGYDATRARKRSLMSLCVIIHALPDVLWYKESSTPVGDREPSSRSWVLTFKS